MRGGNNKTILEYDSYKLFLRDFYKSRTESNSGYSMKVWANSVGLSSPSTLSMILNGDRHPSKSLTECLAKYFEFNKEEQKYFLNLVELEKKLKGSHLTIFLNDLIKKHKAQTKLPNLTTFVIREFINGKYLEDLDNFESLFCLSNSDTKIDIDEHIKFLIEHAIVIIEDQQYKSIANIFEKMDIANSDLQNFHQSIINSALNAFEELEKKDRQFQTSILKIPKSKIEFAKEKLIQFQQEFTETVETESDTNNEIYILNINFFKFLKKLEEK